MKSNELFEQIHAGIIKDNSTIKVMTEEGQVITKIKYENKGLKWEQGKFDTKYLCDIDIEFEVEEPEIDIQVIEKLEYETVIEMLGIHDCFQGNEAYCLKTLSKNDENLLISNAENHKKINELIKAVKQLDRRNK